MFNYFEGISVSANDQDQGSVKLLRVVLTTTVLSLLGIATLLILINHGKMGIGSIGAVVVAMLCGMALFLSHRGIHWAGRVLVPLFALAALTTMAIDVDGLHDSTVVGFTLVIIFTSLLLGQKAIPLATLLTLAAIWVVTYADITGINQSLFAQATKISDAVGLAVVISIFQIIAAASLSGLMSRLNSVLENVRHNEKELLSKNGELEDIRASLEERVIDRTRAAESARSESESARKDLEVQFWLANGQSQLADVLRGEQTVSQLAENILSHLCPYTGAQAGVLFLLVGSQLRIVGSYAYTPRPGFDGAFALGEGLVGQAAMDGKIVYQSVPSDTLIISTGLVNLTPRQIAAAPFFVNGNVVGVLELATISEFTRSHLEFWNRISESLGIAFHTAQTRQRLAELLAASQLQAEELQAQEEELRAANEELQAQAENMKAARRLGA